MAFLGNRLWSRLPVLVGLVLSATCVLGTTKSFGAMLSFDYEVVDISSNGVGRYEEAVSFVPLGSRFTLEFEIGGPYAGVGATCEPTRCVYGLGSAVLSGNGFSMAVPQPDVTGTSPSGTVQGVLAVDRQFVQPGNLPVAAAITPYTILGGTPTDFQVYGRDSIVFSYQSYTTYESFSFHFGFVLDVDPATVGNLDLTNIDNIVDFLTPIGSSNEFSVHLADHLTPNFPFLGTDEVKFTLAPAPSDFSWTDGGGDFGDAAHWEPDGVPGAGGAGEDSASITAPGTYSVSGAPENRLSALTVGSQDGTVTLEPILEPIETERLNVTGNTRLEFGTLNVSETATVNAGATFTVGEEGILDVNGDGGAPPVRVEGTLAIEDTGQAGLHGLDLATEADSFAT